jgi:hypothetical protein
LFIISDAPAVAHAAFGSLFVFAGAVTGFARNMSRASAMRTQYIVRDLREIRGYGKLNRTFAVACGTDGHNSPPNKFELVKRWASWGLRGISSRK